MRALILIMILILMGQCVYKPVINVLPIVRLVTTTQATNYAEQFIGGLR